MAVRAVKPYSITDACNGCGFCVQWCPVKAIHGRRRTRHWIEASCVGCGACGRICAFGAITDAEGVLQTRLPLSAWPKPVWDYSQCEPCLECQSACPAACIRMADNRGEDLSQVPVGKPYLVRPKACLSCGFCVDSCPSSAIRLQTATAG